jgi:hypothetical protein
LLYIQNGSSKSKNISLSNHSTWTRSGQSALHSLDFSGMSDACVTFNNVLFINTDNHGNFKGYRKPRVLPGTFIPAALNQDRSILAGDFIRLEDSNGAANKFAVDTNGNLLAQNITGSGSGITNLNWNNIANRPITGSTEYGGIKYVTKLDISSHNEVKIFSLKSSTAGNTVAFIDWFDEANNSVGRTIIVHKKGDDWRIVNATADGGAPIFNCGIRQPCDPNKEICVADIKVKNADGTYFSCSVNAFTDFMQNPFVE